MHSHLAVWVLFFSAIGWGLTWLPIKGLNDMGLHTLHLITVAFAAPALMLLPWVYRHRSLWLPVLPLMLLISVFGGFANFSFQTALAKGDVIRVMILFYMLPIWSVIGGWFFLKERIDKRRLMALVLCVAGALCILEAWNVSLGVLSINDLLALGAGMGLSASNIIFRFTAHIPLVSKIGFMFLGCVVFPGLYLLFFSSSISAYLPANNAVPLAILYGIAWIMVITFGSQWAVTQLEAGRSAVILVMELVAAVVSVVLLTQNHLGVHEILGAIMVIVAALLEGSRKNESNFNEAKVKSGSEDSTQ